MTSQDVLQALGFSRSELTGGSLAVHSQIYGAEIARIAETPTTEIPAVIARRSPKAAKARSRHSLASTFVVRARS
jgi:hypothetical protein